MAYSLQKLHTKLVNNSNNNVKVGTFVSSKFFASVDLDSLYHCILINVGSCRAKNSEESQIIDARQNADIL